MAAINKHLPRYDIDTIDRVAAFLAQCGHESADFTRLEENLNYSVDGLHKAFPKRFPTIHSARLYAYNPEKIGNKIYADRMGNGPESSGDGYRYRGRGAIQLTGRANYLELADGISKTIDEAVDYCATMEGAVESACWFWKKHGLNAFCERADIVGMTRVINGGTHGLEDRRFRFGRAMKVLLGS